jgi:tetraacyldisaccharide 4'-kinase
MRHWLERQWYRTTPWQWLLWPFSLIFLVLSAVRRFAYHIGLLKTWRAPVPVVVVGNISVGGTGKTPLTLWLAAFLKMQGYKPGIVSRGYGGTASGSREVAVSGSATEFGDEPLVLARRSACPVWVGKSRVAATQGLLEYHPECDVVICDDGLQHYALARDVEIAVFDGRMYGNGMLLPAGPLRELPSRLECVDALVVNADIVPPDAFSMRLGGTVFRSLADKTRVAVADDFMGRQLHAVAGIGNPQRFFETLNKMGMRFVPHSFPDHYRYEPADLQFEDAFAVLMTEKDAVKCTRFAEPHWWYLEVAAELSDGLGALVLQKIRK